MKYSIALLLTLVSSASVSAESKTQAGVSATVMSIQCTSQQLATGFRVCANSPQNTSTRSTITYTVDTTTAVIVKTISF